MRITMKTFIHFFVLALCFSASVAGLERQPPCFRELQTTFFEQNLVAEALNASRVDRALWQPIYRDLQRESSSVPRLVQTLAANRNPNPLSPIFRPEEAFEVLQQALTMTLTNVLFRYRTLNYTINQTTVDGAFRYMWQRQFPKLRSCADTFRQ